MAPNSTMPLSSRQNNTSTTVYLTRHGESNNNLYGRIGGDADLSSRGRQYAKELGSFVKDLKLPSVEVWVTQYRRTQQTAQHLDYPRCVLSLLMGTSLTDLPYMKIPLHTVLQVTMSGDKVTLDQHRLAVDCVDTHRARPTNCMVDRPKEEACHTVPTHL